MEMETDEEPSAPLMQGINLVDAVIDEQGRRASPSTQDLGISDNLSQVDGLDLNPTLVDIGDLGNLLLTPDNLFDTSSPASATSDETSSSISTSAPETASANSDSLLLNEDLAVEVPGGPLQLEHLLDPGSLAAIFSHNNNSSSNPAAAVAVPKKKAEDSKRTAESQTKLDIDEEFNLSVEQENLFHPGHSPSLSVSTASPSPGSVAQSPIGSPGSAVSLGDDEISKENLTHSSRKAISSNELSVIARHRKQGPKSLQQLKEKVRQYAMDHTFKDTGKKFGIHHSTVSGWVKAATASSHKASGHILRLGTGRDFCKSLLPIDPASHHGTHSVGPSLGPCGKVSPARRADDLFIDWLRSCRERSMVLTTEMVLDKIRYVIKEVGTQEIERTCKWFLQWSSRREDKHFTETLIPGTGEDLAAPNTPVNSNANKEPQLNLAYPPAFKLEVALYAQSHSQYAAAKIFSVARRRIFDWMRQVAKLEELIARGHMKKMTGRGPKNRDIDGALYAWYCARKQAGARPKSADVQAKAREIYLAQGYTDMKCSYGWFKRWSQRFKIQLRYSYDDDLLEWIQAKFDANETISHQDLQNHGLALIRKEDPDFKASSGWAMRFCRRHRPLLNPNMAPNTLLGFPTHLVERSTVFSTVLTQLIRQKGFPASAVAAMDELALHLTPNGSSASSRLANTSSRELDTDVEMQQQQQQQQQPSSTVQLRQAGLGRGAVAAVLLAALADGTLLPPLLVLRSDGISQAGQSTAAELNNTLSDVLVLHSDPSEPLLVTEKTILHWLQLVWEAYLSRTPTRGSLLLADPFPAHTAPSVQSAITRKGGCLAIIPSACSARLQPLHKGLKEKFKVLVEMQYLRFLERVRDSATNSEQKRPSNLQMMQWVSKAYNELKEDKSSIRQAFIDTHLSPYLLEEEEESLS